MLELHCSIGRELIGQVSLGLDKIKIHQPKILRDFILNKMALTIAIHKKDLMINEEKANSSY